MSKLLAVMIVGFGVAFGAGATAGMLWERHVAVSPPEAAPAIQAPLAVPAPKPPDARWMKDIVPALNDAQRAQIADIWKKVWAHNPRSLHETLHREHEDFVRNLMNESQRQQSQTLLVKTEARIDDLGKQCRAAQEAEKQKRDDAVRALFDEDQRKQYEAAQKSYKAKLKELDEDWHKTFDSAVKDTEEVLTPEQREQYIKIREHFPLPPPNGFRQGGSHGGPRHGPPGSDHPEGGPPRNFAPPPNPNPN